MSEFTPCQTLDELQRLDPVAYARGYEAGMNGEDEPGETRSRAYWHGWRAGAADSGRRELTDLEVAIRLEFVEVCNASRH